MNTNDLDSHGIAAGFKLNGSALNMKEPDSATEWIHYNHRKPKKWNIKKAGSCHYISPSSPWENQNWNLSTEVGLSAPETGSNISLADFI
jgi:hypothetical protein